MTVRKATLNNWGDIQRKRVAIGARVWIRRSNDVIPEIMGHVGTVKRAKHRLSARRSARLAVKS